MADGIRILPVEEGDVNIQRLKEKVVAAAKEFVATELAQTDYEELKDSSSASMPAEYILLIEAVRELELAQ